MNPFIRSIALHVEGQAIRSTDYIGAVLYLELFTLRCDIAACNIQSFSATVLAIEHGNKNIHMELTLFIIVSIPSRWETQSPVTTVARQTQILLPLLPERANAIPQFSPICAMYYITVMSWTWIFADLSRNRLAKVTNGAFVNLTNLTYLDISYNKLVKLESVSVEPLRKLHTLNVSGNAQMDLYDIRESFQVSCRFFRSRFFWLPFCVCAFVAHTNAESNSLRIWLRFFCFPLCIVYA